MSYFLSSTTHRLGLLAAIAVASGSLVATSAEAATTASGTQAVTGAPVATLTATFPADYAFASLPAGATTTSTEQTVNVKSNASWGVKLASDDAGGLMRRWNGASYVAGSLASALKWGRSSLGGVPVGAPTYASLSSTVALVIGTQGATSDSGVDVGVKFQQAVTFADTTPGADTYRSAVTYTAQQGF